MTFFRDRHVITSYSIHYTKLYDAAILAEGEKLQVVQKMELPPEVLEAQKLIREARALEKQEEFDDALMMYEKAFEMWPDNGKLAALCQTGSWSGESDYQNGRNNFV